MNDQNILLAIILVPLLGALGSYVIDSCQKKVVGLIATLSCAISFFLVLYLTNSFQHDAKVISAFSSEPWFAIGPLDIHWSLAFDHLSAAMCILVTGVGSLIHLFSMGYMRKDPSAPRFFAYLNLFIASMLLLVLGGNLLVLFVGWEGVGLCSYLLIGFWFTNDSYAKAAQKAFVINRISDLGLILCMFVLFYSFNTLEITSILNQVIAGGNNERLYTLVGALLLIAAFGKSAQIPFFTWLPDAMAGPTPVSALIHAATMVTSGIYLIARMSPVFEAVPELRFLLAGIAVLTAFISATIALVQSDIKKVLAYSTVSQLGFMFIALAAGAYWIAIFHVITHGFFKACLFLAAGSVIYGCHHEQNMFKMGGLARKMPLTFASFLVATLALAGIAPLAGYFSKHAIVNSFSEYAVSYSNSYLDILIPVITITSFLTALYMGRCLSLTFFGKYRGEDEHHVAEVPTIMWLPVMALAVLSLVGGWLLEAPLHEFLSFTLPSQPMPHSESPFGAEALRASLPGVIGILIAPLAFFLFPKIIQRTTENLEPVMGVIRRSYLLDEIYDWFIVRPLRLLGWLLWKIGDELAIESVLRLGISIVGKGTRLMSWLQSGQVRQYSLLLFAGFFTIVWILIKGF